MTRPTIRPPFQLAYVVDDIPSAVDRWVRRGAGPFFTNKRHVTYNGPDPLAPTQVAAGQLGPMMIKLMVPREGGFLPSSPGFHSVVSLVDDFDAACAAFEEQGHPIVVRAETSWGLHFAYADTRAELGHEWEIIQFEPGMVGYFDSIAAAAEGWDGSDPIR